jgi:hypothetical protein
VKRAALPIAVVAAVVSLGLLARAADDPADAGTFTLFKFEQAIGEERYEIRPGAEGFTLTSKFSFTDRGTAGIWLPFISSSTETPRASRR